MNSSAKQTRDFTILVVDDEEMLRDAVSFDFKRKGYRVLNAACGHDALAVLDATHVDVVVSDVRMPNGNGIELLSSIKKKNVFVPVVVLVTGFADISLEEAYDLGADAVFPKPFDRKALQEAVERALQPPDARYNRNGVRVDVSYKGEVSGAAGGHAGKGRILNMGRGGFFAEMNDLPQMGEAVKFSIEVEGTPATTIAGSGIVRWARGEQDGAQGPRGCGIEFIQLDDSCRRKFIELINSLKTKAFIPNK